MIENIHTVHLTAVEIESLQFILNDAITWPELPQRQHNALKQVLKKINENENEGGL